MDSVGPLSLHHWKALTDCGIFPKHGPSIVANSTNLVTAMIIASQRHQLRPLVSQFLEQLSYCPCSQPSDLLQAAQAALPCTDNTLLCLDTTSMLLKMVKMAQPSFFVLESPQSLVDRAKLEPSNHLVAFTTMVLAYGTLMHQKNSMKPQCSLLNDLQTISLSAAFHDETRIVAFHMILQSAAIFADSSDSELVKITDFVVEKALPEFCGLNSTPSRERFCSLLISHMMFLRSKPSPVDRILLALVSLSFDESNYATQRVMLRLFQDLSADSGSTSKAVYSKLMALCKSDFHDVRRRAAEILNHFEEKCKQFDLIQPELVSLAQQGIMDAVRAVEIASCSTLDTFLPSKMAFLFHQCMVISLKDRGSGPSLKLHGEKKTLIVSFQEETSMDELLLEVASAIRKLLEQFDESQSLLLLFLLSVGHLTMLAKVKEGDSTKKRVEVVDGYFSCCEKAFWLFFGDDSPHSTFHDKSLGGYLAGREKPAWAILQTVAKNLSTFALYTSKASSTFELRAIWHQRISRVLRRVLFSTLHFGLLEGYSALLCSAVVAWQSDVVDEFTQLFYDMVWSSEEGSNQQLSPAEVRRGGGLSLAFIALCNGLAQIDRTNDIEQLLRFKLLDPSRWPSASVSTQAATFHVLRALFAFGDARSRTALADEVAHLALSSLRMSAPFQTRNAAIQALSACVRPITAEGMSSIWKFARLFPVTWKTIRETVRPDNSEALMLTAALSILANLNPLTSPNDADDKWTGVIDERLEDDLLAIALSTPIAYVRQAAASGLVCVACSDRNADAVSRAVGLLTAVLCIGNKMCSDSARNPMVLVSMNSVHGIILVIDRTVEMLHSSWLSPSLGPRRPGRVPISIDRCYPSIRTTLRRLASLVNPDAAFLQTQIDAMITNLS